MPEQKMQILINVDSNINGRERLVAYVTGVVEDALSRFRERLTKVELHLGDEEHHESGHDDKHCTVRARIKGRQPITAAHRAATMSEAVSGALDKTKRSIESTLERLQDHR
ncbi:MAG: HPF/RaiA family ribosome-associated protein [Myxococcales bacterium]